MIRRPESFFMELRCYLMTRQNSQPLHRIMLNKTGRGILTAESSIHLKRDDHLKDRDIDFERDLIIQILHGIGAIHFPHFRTKVATTDILVSFTRLENRLNAYDTFAFYLPVTPITIEYMPVAAV